jgi:hypothetical protein
MLARSVDEVAELGAGLPPAGSRDMAPHPPVDLVTSLQGAKLWTPALSAIRARYWAVSVAQHATDVSGGTAASGKSLALTISITFQLGSPAL